MKKIKLRITQLFVLSIYILLRPFAFVFSKRYSNTWLISEMGNEARDNGYAFFEYMTSNHPEIDAVFVISKKSKDYKKVRKTGKVINYRSISHYFAYMNSKVLISSQIMGYSPEYRCFTKLHKRLEFFSGKGKKVFLQHGIIKDYLDGLTADVVNLDIFICGAYPEYKYIRDNYGFDKGVVQYTGLARYDDLTIKKPNKDLKCILFMPTWRNYLFYINNDKEFKKSEYYKKVEEVLHNKKLLAHLHKTNEKLIFYPHHEIQQYLSAFKKIKHDKSIIIADNNHYNVPELLRSCKMLITDYSSVFFDIAYQRKPVVYFQYDYSKYRKNHYKEGYFNYTNDGFGPVVDTPALCSDAIIHYIQSHYTTEEKYIRKSKTYFKYKDTNNCKRIFNVIIATI